MSSKDLNSSGRRRSSFFQRAKSSFVRTGGTKGADLPTLRGTRGPDFEGKGQITRGVESGCLCCGSIEDGTKDRILLIKGPFCFVFENENSPSPLYAISLLGLSASKKQTSAGKTPVLLESFSEVEFELSFAEDSVADEFISAVTVQAQRAASNEVKKKLGHDHLLNQRASVVYAAAIAKSKIADQPSEPITATEIMSNITDGPQY